MAVNKINTLKNKLHTKEDIEKFAETLKDLIRKAWTPQLKEELNGND